MDFNTDFDTEETLNMHNHTYDGAPPSSYEPAAPQRAERDQWEN